MNQSSQVLFKIQNIISEFLTSKGVEGASINFEKPEIAEYGDMSTSIALKYAKALGMTPTQLAEEIVAELQAHAIEEVAEYKVEKPGFINIYFNNKFQKLILEDVLASGSNYGHNESMSRETWVIEHTSPNPNKAMHLGHLRNNLIGMGLSRLLEARGAKVIRDAIYNDRGIAIAKLMWGYLAHMRRNDEAKVDIKYWISNKESWHTPESLGIPADIFVSRCYIMGEADTKSSPETDQVVRDMVLAWESEDADTWDLWRTVLGYSYEGINITLSRLGNKWDNIWYEHEHYKAGKAYVEKGLTMGIFKKLEDGAVLTNLESYKLPDTILLKNDGSSLYITQDIALTDLKKKKWNANKLVWVVGPDQSNAMKQLYAVCEQLGIGSISDFTHIAYGYVGVKGEDGEFKKMSSRDGTSLLIDELIDKVKIKIAEELSNNSKESALSDGDLEKLAMAAIKFSILKINRNQDIAFDISSSIAISGDSGIYILYTITRINSLLQKAKESGIVYKAAEQPNGAELVKSLYRYPEVLNFAKSELSLNPIAQYAMEVTTLFNSWYASESILTGGDVQHKIAIVSATKLVLENALTILGIDTVESM